MTADHCVVRNLDDAIRGLSNEVDISFADNKILSQKEFEDYIWQSIDNKEKFNVKIIKNLKDYLWKEFFILWEKNWKNYMLQWFLIEIKINKENWVSYWVIFFPNWDLEKFGSTWWLSGSPVFVLWEYDWIIWVLSWEKIWDNPNTLIISFLTDETEG